MSINRQIVVPLLVLVMYVLGCGLFSDKGDAELVFAPTEVGTPEGEKVTKEIGPAGGALASKDGRITLTVPKNALTETLSFSIQPISNKAGTGIGLAYRLEPNGKTFTTPLDVSVRYEDKDLEGTFPEALSIAYQDTSGGWLAFTTPQINTENKTLNISTTHFTDVSVVTYRLLPQKATLRVGETQYLEVVGCRNEGSLLNRLRKLVGRGSQQICDSSSVSQPSWSAQRGTIVPNGKGALYTAPAKKPSPNVDKVHLTYIYGGGNGSIGVYEAEITIVDRGYRASGQDGPVVYSGTVCSLDSPFEIAGNHPMLVYPFKFVPTSPTTGTMSFSVGKGSLQFAGTGTYTVEGIDTETPRLVLKTSSTARAPGASSSGSGPATINLAPLETGECR